MFQLYHGGHFYWWGTPEYPEKKPPTCRKSLTNFITQCCIYHTSTWTGSNSPHWWWLICTDYTGSCKSNYHTITTATALVSAICGFAGSCDYREKNTAPVSFGVQLGVDTLHDCHLFEINPEGYRVVLIFFENKLLNIQSNNVTGRFLNAIFFFFLWCDSKPHYWYSVVPIRYRFPYFICVLVFYSLLVFCFILLQFWSFTS